MVDMFNDGVGVMMMFHLCNYQIQLNQYKLSN